MKGKNRERSLFLEFIKPSIKDDRSVYSVSDAMFMFKNSEIWEGLTLDCGRKYKGVKQWTFVADTIGFQGDVGVSTVKKKNVERSGIMCMSNLINFLVLIY